jgi:hypothetical protein
MERGPKGAVKIWSRGRVPSLGGDIRGARGADGPRRAERGSRGRNGAELSATGFNRVYWIGMALNGFDRAGTALNVRVAVAPIGMHGGEVCRLVPCPRTTKAVWAGCQGLEEGVESALKLCVPR